MDEYNKNQGPMATGDSNLEKEQQSGAYVNEEQTVQSAQVEEVTVSEPFDSQDEQNTNKNDNQTAGEVKGNPYVRQYFEQEMNPETKKGKASGTAIASMVLGIVGLVLSCCCCCIPIVGSVIAIIAGGVGLILGIFTLVKQGQGAMAISGVIMCAFAILFGLCGVLLSSFAQEILKYLDEFMQENYPGEFPPLYSDGMGRG